MKVKSIRGSIKYDGTVYDEGQEFEILDTDFNSLQENVEVVSTDDKSDEKNNKDSEEVLDNQEEENIIISEGEKMPFSVDEVMDIDLQDVDLNSFKVDELKKIAKAKGIDIPEKATKKEIIELLGK